MNCPRGWEPHSETGATCVPCGLGFYNKKGGDTPCLPCCDQGDTGCEQTNTITSGTVMKYHCFSKLVYNVQTSCACTLPLPTTTTTTPSASAAVRSKAGVLSLIHCLSLFPMFVGCLCFGHCLVMQYVVSFLVFQ